MSSSASAAPERIFISYRRDDTAYPAGWLYDRLTDRLGQGHVFKDVDSVELGEDFVEVITNAVGSCDVLLALIGDRWLSATDDEGRRRLDDPNDFVRIEIEGALQRGVRVIPILVDGARMPRPGELPPSLAGLARRQALDLSPRHFDTDTDRVLQVLAPATTTAPAPPPGAPEAHGIGKPAAWTAGAPPAPPSPRPSARASSWPRPLVVGGLVTAGIVGVALVVLVGAIIATSGSESPNPQPPGSQQTATTSSGTQVPDAIFADDFSDPAAGWQNDGDGKGAYLDGAYRMQTGPVADGGGASSSPLKVASLYPTAPPAIRIEATVRVVSSTADTAVGVLCRASGDDAYAFLVAAGQVAIAKITAAAPFTQLATGTLTLDPNGRIRLQAVCREDGAVQRLALAVNGKPVLEATDGLAPLGPGTVGVGVLVGSGTDSIVADFDEFVVSAA